MAALDATRVSEAFASDNYAGAHPEVLNAMVDANVGFAGAYGADPWTARLGEVARRHFGEASEVFPVFNGTGANVIGVQSLVPKWGAVICAEGAHLATDECGAPERVGGVKLLTVPTTDGKLTPELVERQAWGLEDEHRARPSAISVTQATEVGTVYAPEDLRALADQAHGLGLWVHMDGARLANAAAHLEVTLGALTSEAGVDVLSLGGTKNGGLFAEAVVVLNPDAVQSIRYLRKMDTQLASKMRFLSVQLLALYEGDLWLRSARHANEMAARLATALAGIDGVRVTQATQANGVFATFPEGVVEAVREQFSFHEWSQETGEVRLMCSFASTSEDVAALVAAVREAVG